MKILQFGRSMIEMLGVLAIIGVLSIGGLLGYRRAVNNHQANVILDDVNRFAFVILERSGLALDAEIDKGDFKESGIYNLKGYQSEEAQGFSITVQSVPKGVCEALLPKAVLEYKVGIVTAGGSVDDEVIYDTLNTDLCKDTSDIAFYFGDTSGVCNEPDGDGPCTQNSDCCGGYFCAFENPTGCIENVKGNGTCVFVEDFKPDTTSVNGHIWVRSKKTMSWWSAQNWCTAQGKSPTSRTDLGCSHVINDNYCTKSVTEANTGGISDGLAYEGSTLRALQDSGWSSSTSGWHWLSDGFSSCSFYDVVLSGGHISIGWRNLSFYALCH